MSDERHWQGILLFKCPIKLQQPVKMVTLILVCHSWIIPFLSSACHFHINSTFVRRIGQNWDNFHQQVECWELMQLWYELRKLRHLTWMGWGRSSSICDRLYEWSLRMTGSRRMGKKILEKRNKVDKQTTGNHYRAPI